MSNPGPAITTGTNFQPVNNQQALVLVAFKKGLDVGTAGDTAVSTVGPVSKFVPTTVVTTNASGDVHLATVGVYTAASQGGTAVLTTAALTSQTTTAYAKVQAATAAAAQVTVNGGKLFLNVGTTVAGLTTDIYVYGYNVS
jgi:hypothetical protein